MVELLTANPFLLIPGFLLLFVFGYPYLFRRHYRRKKRQLPPSRNLLRSPGQSLLNELDVLNQEVILYAGLLFSIPILSCAGYLVCRYFSNQSVSMMELGLLCLVGFGTVGYSLNRLSRLLRKRRQARMSYEGKMAVGRILDQLAQNGYHVFHDFPAGRFNIDHVLVGEKGVFTVETRVRSKPTSSAPQNDAPVEYNGKVLYFPNGKDLKTVERAEGQADWLSEWIGVTTGVPLAVRAIVALPGWVVKRTSADGIPVVNPGQFSSLFEHVKSRPISEDAHERIIHQLELKCRNAGSGPTAAGSAHGRHDTTANER